ncbi:MAG: LysR family transcriptional regulator [Proteobacteria bacterium]|nr:LysR family transcriptional regulator [Pseudomonadota bacterium]
MAVNFRTLDLNLLRVFDVVMAERNLTRAAERLSITQPAVSNALRRLREAVGEDLLTRNARGVAPTPRADELWAEVRVALAQLRGALEPSGFSPQTDAVSFRIAMADVTAAMLMPALVARIEAAGAVANLRVLPLIVADPRPMLERGEADLAVGYFPEAVAAVLAQGARASLRHERLLAGGYVCVMRRGHPLADADFTLDAYCEAHHLLVSFSGRAYGPVDEILAARNRSRRIVLTVNQYYTAGRVVARSDLITVLPLYFVDATGSRDQLVARPLPFELEAMHIEALWHMRHDRIAAHQWLRAGLIEAARAVAY